MMCGCVGVLMCWGYFLFLDVRSLKILFCLGSKVEIVKIRSFIELNLCVKAKPLNVFTHINTPTP